MLLEGEEDGEERRGCSLFVLEWQIGLGGGGDYGGVGGDWELVTGELGV